MVLCKLITEKAYRRLNILRRFKFILDRKTLETIYLTYIRPLLEYADVIWDNNITYLVCKIEKVQMEAARIVSPRCLRLGTSAIGVSFIKMSG
jgi:hypothetical protein